MTFSRTDQFALEGSNTIIDNFDDSMSRDQSYYMAIQIDVEETSEESWATAGIIGRVRL